ncbi:hypothetical protein Efla_003981 [Eimeria flavescens]
MHLLAEEQTPKCNDWLLEASCELQLADGQQHMRVLAAPSRACLPAAHLTLSEPPRGLRMWRPPLRIRGCRRVGEGGRSVAAGRSRGKRPLLRIHLNNPHGHSIRNRLIDSSYGFFFFKVGDDICNSPASKELAQPPSLVLQQADALLQRHSQLREVLLGTDGKTEASLLAATWVSRFAQATPHERRALQRQLLQLQSDSEYEFPSELHAGAAAGLSPELLTAAYVHSQCMRRKEALATPPEAAGNAADADGFFPLRLSSQQFLHGRFLGDPERICWGFRREGSSDGLDGWQQQERSRTEDICAPPLEVALQLVPLRLYDWWARVRWQYHLPEYVRKLLTVFFPLNPYMHQLYRQDMFAMLTLMGPYLELEPPVPVDQTCRPPKPYWVVPLTHDQWSAEGFAEGTRRIPAAAGEAEAGDGRPLLSSVFSLPKEHDNFLLVDKYCEDAREIHHGFFSGKPRKKAVKIVDAVILGYDLDLLEIRWHELYHSVDYFVVAEAHHHTLGVFQKPLFFARNRDRYAAFADKVIHLVPPVEASLPVAKRCSERLLRDEDACWEYEMFQRDSMLHMLAQINAGVNDYGNSHIKPGFLDDSDLVLVSDVDEIVMGDRLRHLKFCEPLPQKQFGWVLVHYPGRVDAMALKEFKSMSGIKETKYPHGIGPLVDVVPYKSIRHLQQKADFSYDRHAYVRHCPSELQPHRYLHGGWHLSDSSYLPYLYAKVPSDDLKPGYEPWGLYAPLLAQRGFFASPIGGIVQAQLAVWKEFRDYRQVGSLCVEAKDVPEQYKEIGFGSMPWVMRCNPMRYPTWFQQPDPRYALRPRTSFVVYGQSVDAHSLQDWFSIYRFVRDTFSAELLTVSRPVSAVDRDKTVILLLATARKEKLSKPFA